MGHNINNVKGHRSIVALCPKRRLKYARAYSMNSRMRKCWDYRKMYTMKWAKSIDGVIIATADHTHAIITADAMTMVSTYTAEAVDSLRLRIPFADPSWPPLPK